MSAVRNHWLCPIAPKEAAEEAARQIKFTAYHLYHQQDLIHVFHVVPDIKTIRGAKKLDPNDEANAQKFFKSTLEPILQDASANYVYEVAHADEVASNLSRGLGELIDIRGTEINAAAIIVERRKKRGMLGLEDQLGSIIKYLLKHSERPVCVLPPEPELPDTT